MISEFNYKLLFTLTSPIRHKEACYLRLTVNFLNGVTYFEGSYGFTFFSPTGWQ